MSAHFVIDRERNLVHAQASGVVGIEDAFTLMAAINSHPDYQKGMGTLLDLRHTSVHIKVDQLVTLAEAVRQLRTVRGRVGIALITDSDLTFGMGRIVGASLRDDDVQVAVFRDESDAVAWLRDIAIGSGYHRHTAADANKQPDDQTNEQ